MLKCIIFFLSHARYTFELSRRTHVPEVFLSKILEQTSKSLQECCDSEDSTACFNAKVQLARFLPPPGLEQRLAKCSL